MLSPEATARHRARLRAHLSGPILLMGQRPVVRNIPINHLPFRQCSTFLWATGCATPGAALLLDDDGDTLFLPEPPPGDGLWHGPQPTPTEQARALGFSRVRPRSELAQAVGAHATVHSLAVTDATTNAELTTLTARPHATHGPFGSEPLVDAIIALRMQLDSHELAEMRSAAAVTTAAHRAAMAVTRSGTDEARVGAIFDGVIAARGMVPAYDSIVTVRGEVLHNHSRHNVLEDGQLLLLDGGAEAPSGYATDVTRTWPVSGRFTARQSAVYDAVLEAQGASIALCQPGTRYRDVHLETCRVLTRFLVDEGLLRGSVDSLVERGAHALFFPHGVGHLIGLDVHDLELYGDRAGYAPGRSRSEQFGLAYLRLDRDLAPGHVVTVEPGFYVVPEILQDTALTEPLADAVNLELARSWVGFGGIRIEDDVLITDHGPDVLTAAIPKSRPDVEAACAAPLRPFW